MDLEEGGPVMEQTNHKGIGNTSNSVKGCALQRVGFIPVQQVDIAWLCRKEYLFTLKKIF